MSEVCGERRWAVVGGGITGLAAAHRLVELDPRGKVVLYEAAARVGGVIETVRRDGYLIERSADSFLNSEQVPWGRRLCERIGFADELQGTDQRYRGAYVVFRGRLVPLPEGFTLLSPAKVWPVATTPLLSLAGKARLAWEYFVPRRTDGKDESLADFCRRRLGKETYERIVQPLVGGIYTADPEQLSMQATMRQFVDLEQKYGSLIRGARRRTSGEQAAKGTSGARYNLFVTPRNGLSSLIEAIAARLPPGTIRLGSRVTSIAAGGDGSWRVNLAEDKAETGYSGVIVAAPAARAAEMVTGFASDLAEELRGIPYAGTSVVVLAYRREQIAHKLDAFGFVVPLVEKRRILAASFPSIKFSGRAPEGMVLVRVFVGGACQKELAAVADAPLQELVHGELRALLGITGEPEFCTIHRYPEAMPQYHVGHLDRVGRIETLADKWRGLAFAGNAYRGVGVPYCVRSGEQAAEKVYSAATTGSGPASEIRSAPPRPAAAQD